MNINAELLQPGSLRDAVSTVAHEGRHAYQHQSIQFPEQHPELTTAQIETWRDNFYDYTPYDENFERYLSQPVEADAYAFEDTVLRMLSIPTLSTSRTIMDSERESPTIDAASSSHETPAGPEQGVPAREIPTPIDNEVIFRSPAPALIEEKRLDFFGEVPEGQAPVALSDDQAQLLLKERNNWDQRRRANDLYALRVNGETVSVANGTVAMGFDQQSQQFFALCDPAAATQLRSHLDELRTKEWSAARSRDREM